MFLETGAGQRPEPALDDNARVVSTAGFAMRVMFTLGSLLIVLAIIGVSVSSQLRANRRLLSAAGAASGASSAPFGGSNSPSVSQVQSEFDQALKASARHTEEQAASAGEDGTR
jgi:hypothetical protein